MIQAAVCRVCGNSEENQAWRLDELLFCSGESFDYFQCNACGCLQIASIPQALGSYYPDEYFAFRRYDKLARSTIRGFFDRARVRDLLGKSNLLGKLGNRLAKPLEYMKWVRLAGVDVHSPVLDVGCGGGKILILMKMGGFETCRGVDPFIPETLRYPNGVTVYKSTMAELGHQEKTRFDLIMLHHSLEHMPDQLQAMREVSALLSDNGAVLIRIPVASSYAWEHYRGDWVQLDPPRHLYLHTHDSLRKLAAQVGLEVVHQYCDAVPSTLLWSEAYRRNKDSRLGREIEQSGLDSDEIAAFKARNDELNQQMRGDQAVYILKRSVPKGEPS